jgi:hypothetical protein
MAGLFFGAEFRTKEKEFQVLYNHFVLTLHYFKKTTLLTTIIASARCSFVFYCKPFYEAIFTTCN